MNKKEFSWENIGRKQYDQIGRFFELLNDQFSYKSYPNTIVNVWAVLKNMSVKVKILENISQFKSTF